MDVHVHVYNIHGIVWYTGPHMFFCSGNMWVQLTPCPVTRLILFSGDDILQTHCLSDVAGRAPVSQPGEHVARLLPHSSSDIDWRKPVTNGDSNNTLWSF